MPAVGARTSWGSLLAGLGAVAAIPLAIYLTRFSESYKLLHSAVAIPLAVVLGVTAVELGGRARKASSASLVGREPARARVGRILGILALCLAASALVALGVYGLLEYVGSRD